MPPPTPRPPQLGDPLGLEKLQRAYGVYHGIPSHDLIDALRAHFQEVCPDWRFAAALLPYRTTNICQEMSPDALLEASVCMSSLVGPGCGGVGLVRAVGDGVASGFQVSGPSVIAFSVPCAMSPVPLCSRCTEPADLTCIASRVGNSARLVSGLLSGTCSVMVGGAVVTLVALALVPQPCAPPAACAGICGRLHGRPCRCCGAVACCCQARGAPIVLKSGPPRVVLWFGAAEVQRARQCAIALQSANTYETSGCQLL